MEQKSVVMTNGYPILEWIPGVTIYEYTEDHEEEGSSIEEATIVVNDAK